MNANNDNASNGYDAAARDHDGGAAEAPLDVGAYRRAIGERSLAAFAQVYFPHYCTLPPSPMHRELYLLLEAATERRGARLAIAAPRGHAKTTSVTTLYLLWCLCYGHERFIVLIGDTAQQAENHLAKAKQELEANALLQADFPGVCEVPGERPSPRRWRANEFVTRSGAMVTALGVGQRVRGRSNRQDRPGLILLDDADNDAAADSPDRRLKLIDYFERAVLKAGTPRTNVVVVGTILHYDTLLGRLVDPAKGQGWTARIYRAIVRWPERADLWEQWESVYTGQGAYLDHPDRCGPTAAAAMYEDYRDLFDAGAEVLWPEKESLYDLMVSRLREGRASFDAEKQNDPVNPADCAFREEDLQYWDAGGHTVEDLLRAVPGRLFIAVDPSLGKTGARHSDSAVAGLLQASADGRLYVVEADVRRRPPDQIIAAVLEMQRRLGAVRVGVETVQFQDYWCDQLEATAQRAGVGLPVHRIKSTTDKYARIVSLQPLLTGGRLLLSKRHRTLLDQLRRFPKAAQDDGPDALAMAVDLAMSFQAPEILFLNMRTGRVEASEGDDGSPKTWGDEFDERLRRFIAE